MSHRRWSDRGGIVLELTIVFPLVLWLLMLSVQWGLWWHAKQTANAAAAEAVSAAKLPDSTALDGETAALSWLDESGNLTNIIVSVDRGDALVTAEVQGDAPRLVPGWGWGVTARSQAPTERFIPEDER